MKIQQRRFKPVQKMRGAVLLVSLVILLVMTLLGVSAMQSTTLDVQMATNDQARLQALQAAEAALAVVEKNIQAEGYNIIKFQTCTRGNADCYDSACAGGLCFAGSFNIGEDQYDCKASRRSPLPEKVWRDTTLNVWNTATKHKTLQIEGVKNEVKYIVEFLCFTQKADGVEFSPHEPNNGAPLYRITALATSDSGKARVALQSTYRYSFY